MTELEREVAQEHCRRWRRSRKAPLEILASLLTVVALLLLIISLAHAGSIMEPLSQDGHVVDSSSSLAANWCQPCSALRTR
jgi:anti-sigma factor RsiW